MTSEVSWQSLEVAAEPRPQSLARPPSQTPEVEETKMRKLGIVLAALACLSFVVVPVASAQAFNWGVGANLGVGIFTPDSKYEGEKSVTSFGWPMGGIRFSFAGEKPMHEVYFESALVYMSSDGSSLYTFKPSLNYQFNFDMKGSATPYVTAGVGLNMIGASGGDDSESASAAFYGGGLGIQHWMGNKAGRLRAEVRYDLQSENTKGIMKGGEFGLKLGFDLWDKK